LSSLKRMLEILDLFDLERSFWTSEQIMSATEFTRPTTFRYLKALREVGLVARFGGGYVLGAKSVKLDYIIRQTDPFQKLFEPIVDRLRDTTDCDVIVASLLGEDFFATIHARSESTKVSWPRGRPMPLTRGAGGLVVLGSLPPSQLRRILAAAAVMDSGLSLDQLRKEIATVAKQGYAISFGALEPENVGIALPIAAPGMQRAALIIVMSRKRFATTNLDVILQLLREARAEMLKVYATHEQ
jgi:DNA-binding IclR family transcriptional regulator